MAARAAGRGSSHGIDGAILETRVGSTRTVLETATPEGGEGAGRKSGTLHLAQAQSNRGPRGRKKEQKLREELRRRIVWTMYVEGDGDSAFEDTVFAMDAIQGLGGKVVWITPMIREEWNADRPQY
jgi:hypothetical protein